MSYLKEVRVRVIKPGNKRFPGADFMPLASEEKRNIVASLTDRYKPWDQWTVREQGSLIVIDDSFRPPSQTGEAPKLDKAKIPIGYFPVQHEARVPASALFDNGWDYLREVKFEPQYGATPTDSVARFNKQGLDNTPLTSSSVIDVTREWRRRMGIVKEGSYRSLYIGLSNGVTLRFPHEYTDSSEHTYSRLFTRKDMANIGYGMLMVGHLMPRIDVEEGDFFFARVDVGDKGPEHMVAVEVDSVADDMLGLVCYTVADQASHLLKRAIIESGRQTQYKRNLENEIPVYLKSSPVIKMLSYWLGWNPLPFNPSSEQIREHNNRTEKFDALAGSIARSMIAFEVNIPDPDESIA